MTDSEIIKALFCCKSTSEKSCEKCPLDNIENGGACVSALSGEAFDLIQRQQAEIENLKEINAFLSKTLTENAQRALEVAIEEEEIAKTKAIQDFAKRLSDKISDKIERNDNNSDGCNYFITDIYKDIDILVKEMLEED